jgi:hypothetical protein
MYGMNVQTTIDIPDELNAALSQRAAAELGCCYVAESAIAVILSQEVA